MLLCPTSSPQIMIVLEPENAVLYAVQNGHWQAQQTLAITHARPWPRDLRGRLVLRKDHLFDAYLPGVFCQSTDGGSVGPQVPRERRSLAAGDEPSALSAFFTPSTKLLYWSAFAGCSETNCDCALLFRSSTAQRKVHAMDVQRSGWASSFARWHDRPDGGQDGVGAATSRA